MGARIKKVLNETEIFHPGDEIIKINSFPVEDQLDIIFHMDEIGEIDLVIRKNDGRIIKETIESSNLSKIGVIFEEMKFIKCRSNCVFCFVDQMPEGLRGTLYKKDDDYRLSFLYGNYVTLNDIKREEIERIIEYHLSPIYVSVHSVNKRIREYLFGRTIPNNILKLLEDLADGGITIHAQIVVIPGINDGEVLEESIDKLSDLYPACKSVAVVPIGLTAHRRKLPDLKGFDKDNALKLVDWAENKDRQLTGWPKTNQRFFYLSDEFFFLAGKKIPDSNYYGDFDQSENGVGMSRLFIEEIKNEIKNLRRQTDIASEFTVVTGKLGYNLISEYLIPIIKKDLTGLKINLIYVPNKLFGDSVTVSGLLSGRDIIEEINKFENISGPIVLPPNSFNNEGLLIDNYSISDLRNELKKEIIVPESNFLENSIVKA
ncbi:MAG TPA: DUF512 domain-containing protein [Candidatus Krumholzibacteriaceae bacterium]|nr:DUF512 domain-containing protein [Candidatus Krumholzibacteriaceae bacterium]